MLVCSRWSFNMGSAHWKTTKNWQLKEFSPLGNLLLSVSAGPQHKRIHIGMRTVPVGVVAVGSRSVWPEIPGQHLDFDVTDHCQHSIFRECIWMASTWLRGRRCLKSPPVQRPALEHFLKACNKLGPSSEFQGSVSLMSPVVVAS